MARQTFSMLVRVVDELCAVEQTRELIHLITKFISRLVKEGNYTFARILRFILYNFYNHTVDNREIPGNDETLL